jgi:hypothetical protein
MLTAVVKIGNYITAAYTDPETLTSATAVLVCADKRTVLVRDTKNYAFGMPESMLSGYANSSIKTYIDLVVQAIADSAQYTLTPQPLRVGVAFVDIYHTVRYFGIGRRS